MNKKTLQDLIEDSPCNGEGWCFLRALIEHTGLSDRQAEQIRLFFDHKWRESQKVGYDVGEEYAVKDFIGKYGEKFAKVWKEGMTHAELFEAIFGEKYVPSKNARALNSNGNGSGNGGNTNGNGLSVKKQADCASCIGA